MSQSHHSDNLPDPVRQAIEAARAAATDAGAEHVQIEALDMSDPADVVSIGLSALMTAAHSFPTALVQAAEHVMTSNREDAIVALHGAIVGLVVGLAIGSDDRDTTPADVVESLARAVARSLDDDAWAAFRAEYETEKLRAAFNAPAYGEDPAA